MSIRVREQARLQDGIGRRLDIRNQMRRRKCNLIPIQLVRFRVELAENYLFNLCKVVLRIFIQNKLSDGTQRELGVWPDLGQVKNIVTEVLGLFRSHCLLSTWSDQFVETDIRGTYNVHCPRGMITGINRVEK